MPVQDQVLILTLSKHTQELENRRIVDLHSHWFLGYPTRCGVSKQMVSPSSAKPVIAENMSDPRNAVRSWTYSNRFQFLVASFNSFLWPEASDNASGYQAQPGVTSSGDAEGSH